MARTMPSNLDAEMSVLGVVFINNKDADKICEEMYVDMFFDVRNQILFECIKDLYRSNTPIDITTVKDLLEKKGKLNEVGLNYLTDIIDSVVTSANLEHYMGMVKEAFIRRNLITTATDIVTTSFEEENINYLLDNSEKKMLNVLRSRSTGEFLTLSNVLKSTQEKLEQRAKNKKLVTGLETGFYDFDKVTTGFQGGELIILAARPGMGKTALALNMATFASSTTDKAIAIFNLEMPADMLADRMISSVGQIDSYKISTGNMQENDWKRYNEAILKLSEANVYIEDNSGITCAEIRAKCRRLASLEKGLGLVVIDYLQLISSGNKRIESRQVEVSEISRSLKTMALELKVPVIALSQLSRTAEKRESNQPMLADLRESGSLEQDADMVLFINRKDYYEKKDVNTKIVPASLSIAKHRKGSLGNIDLLFELNTGSFKNVLNENKGES